MPFNSNNISVNKIFSIFKKNKKKTIKNSLKKKHVFFGKKKQRLKKTVFFATLILPSKYEVIQIKLGIKHH